LSSSSNIKYSLYFFGLGFSVGVGVGAGLETLGDCLLRNFGINGLAFVFKDEA
jgi:hypothetical protein